MPSRYLRRILSIGGVQLCVGTTLMMGGGFITSREITTGCGPPPNTITLVGGHLYGPGRLSDQALPPGELRGLLLSGFLQGQIPQFNNLGEIPNIPAEVLQGKLIDGRLSDGTLINERIDVGCVTLMGQLKLLLAAVGGGPNGGRVNFYLDRDWNWTIRDDIAIDPGFPSGIIKFNDFVFSTKPRRLPWSTQTVRGLPGGVDRAGSKISGGVVPGHLGDDDFDGRLDGIFNAVGSFPLTSMFLPGAPFAQTRIFISDVPVSHMEAAFLSIASARSQLLLASELSEPSLEQERVALASAAVAKLQRAIEHVERVIDREPASERAYQSLRAAREVSARIAEALRVDRSSATYQTYASELKVLGTRLLALRQARSPQ